MSHAKGASYERELVNRFLDAGWGALRLGASGSGGDADLPDVLAGTPIYAHHGGRLQRVTHDVADWHQQGDLSRIVSGPYAIELKSGKATTLYVTEPELKALRAFARRWGARPFLGARYTTRGSATATYLVAPESARGPTDAGRYGLPVADIEKRAYAVVSDDGVERL